MIELLIDNEEKTKVKFRLVADDGCMPLHLKDNVWEHIFVC